MLSLLPPVTWIRHGHFSWNCTILLFIVNRQVSYEGKYWLVLLKFLKNENTWQNMIEICLKVLSPKKIYCTLTGIKTKTKKKWKKRLGCKSKWIHAGLCNKASSRGLLSGSHFRGIQHTQRLPSSQDQSHHHLRDQVG